ncbi:MAG: ABC transporter permease [Rhizomicrobium sp.]|jgi:peptide/nickel transport system permease protein
MSAAMPALAAPRRWVAWCLSTPAGRFSAIVLVIFAASALLAPWLTPYDPNHISVYERLASPSWQHWLGTDQIGRDMLTRVLYGARVALAISVGCTSVSLILGVAFGALAGVGPRVLDAALMLLFDTINSLPTVLLALAIMTLIGSSLPTLMGLIVLFYVPYFGRIARGQTRVLVEAPFIEAERMLGASTWRILRDHLMPNLLGPMAIIASMEMPSVISLEAGLSFLGLGVRAPTATWGNILQDGYIFIRDTPWIAIAGGVPLVLTTLAFTFLGEMLRDRLDPKLRKEVT